MFDTSESGDTFLRIDNNPFNQHLIESDESSNAISRKSDNEATNNRAWYKLLFSNEFKPFWLAGILIISIFIERFWFIVTIYKTKGHGYVLILIISILNLMLIYANNIISKKWHKKKLYEYFQSIKIEHVGIWVMLFVSILDLFSILSLYLAANELPIGVLITYLQLYIPFNIIIRRLFLGYQNYVYNWLTVLLIIFAWLIWYIRLGYFTQISSNSDDSNSTNFIYFLCLSSFLEVISLSIKEYLIRSQSVSNESFNLKLSLCQFLIGLILCPIIIGVFITSRRESANGIFSNTIQYIYQGLECAISFTSSEGDNNQNWSFSLIYIIGYAISTFLYQILLKALFERNKILIIRKILAFIIPITVIAFTLGIPAISPIRYNLGVHILDVISVLITFAGVFRFYWYDEQTTKTKVDN